MVRFSERHGYKSARETIQVSSISAELRNSLWNVLTTNVWDHVRHSRASGGKHITETANSEMWQLCRRLWFSYFKNTFDTLDYKWTPILGELRRYFFDCEWYEVYDFVEFVAQNFPYSERDEFISGCNSVLQRELSGYRFVGLNITPITNETEINEIDEALTGAASSVRTHLARALELLSDRKSPDYRNSIKESISAVESLVAATLGKKETLGQLIKKLEVEIGLHPAFRDAFSSLYGYTSDQGGIRHALMELPSVTFEDAKFLLVVCSAFVNFVKARVLVSSGV